MQKNVLERERKSPLIKFRAAACDQSKKNTLIGITNKQTNSKPVIEPQLRLLICVRWAPISIAANFRKPQA